MQNAIQQDTLPLFLIAHFLRSSSYLSNNPSINTREHLQTTEIYGLNPANFPLSPAPASLITELEQYLHELLNSVYRHYQLLFPTTSSTQPQDLPVLTKAIANEIHDRQRLVQQQWLQQDEELLQVTQLLVQEANLLSTILQKHVLNNDYSKTRVQFLNHTTATLRLKIQHVAYRLMVETYTKKKLQTLELIRTYLLHQRQQQLEKQAKLKEKLQYYKSAPPEFHALHQKYHQLQLEIQQRKDWIASLD